MHYKTLPNLGESPHGVVMLPRQKIDNYKRMQKKQNILSHITKFSAGQPLLPAYNFSTTMPLRTYCLGAVAFLKFLVIENMPQIMVQLCTVD